MNKAALRHKYKTLRSQLSLEAVENGSLAIANKVLSMHIWDKNYFHLYLPITEQKEVDTEFILQILAGKDKNILVSKSNFATTTMTHFLLTDNTKFQKNQYNIPEPVEGIEVPISKIEVVFIPLLAYDTKGNRVGYGKGFYDTFLAACNPNIIKIGLSFFEPEDCIEDVVPTDMKLDYCITPQTIVRY